MTQKSESVRELEQANKWILANQPEPSLCIYCGHAMTNCSMPSGLTWNPCPISPTKNHTYNFVSDPDWEAKRLTAYAKSVTLQLAQRAEMRAKTFDKTSKSRNKWLAFAAWLREKAR